MTNGGSCLIVAAVLLIILLSSPSTSFAPSILSPRVVSRIAPSSTSTTRTPSNRNTIHQPIRRQQQRQQRNDKNGVLLTNQIIPNSSIESTTTDDADIAIMNTSIPAAEESTMDLQQQQQQEEDTLELERLGWQPHFANQYQQHPPTNDANTNNDNEEKEEKEEEPLIPVRIAEVHNQGISIIGANIEHELIPNIPPKPDDDETTTTTITLLVGDWILINPRRQIRKLLNRKSLLQRRAPGRGLGGKIQRMAANVDTVFIVSSCNQDFNVARIERYVAMVLEAGGGVTPVLVLTKRDHWDGLEDDDSLLPFYRNESQEIVINNEPIAVVLLDARGTEPTQMLRQWVRPGQTVAFLGSSGVGKSTLVNSLCGDTVAKTGDIHEDSGRGRHTTTRRQLHFLDGCAIMDTPGLRELQLIQASHGVATVFADLVELSKQCGFRDCQHMGEPDCAIETAIVNEKIDEERVERWQKLVLEDQANMKTMKEHEQRRRKGGEKPKKKAMLKSQQRNQRKKNKKYQKRLKE